MKKMSMIMMFLLALCVLVFAAAKKVEVKTLHIDNSEAARKLPPQLIYSGSNETISQALYNVDLLDGKIDEPHIVHKDIDKNHHILTFIGKDGEVKRVLTLSDEASKIDITITRNQRYAMVVGEYRERDFSATTRFYDIEGNLLWEKKRAYTCYYVSPDGNFIIEAPGWDYQSIHLPRTYTVMNAKGEKLNEFEVKMDGKIYFGNDYQKFTENGKYCLMLYGIGGWQNNYRLVMVDNTGKVTFDRNFKGLYTNPYNTQPMNNGMLVYDYSLTDGGAKITKIYSNGKEIYKQEGTKAIFVSLNDNVFINTKDVIFQYTAMNNMKIDWEYDQILGKILLENNIFLMSSYREGIIAKIVPKSANSDNDPREYLYLINNNLIPFTTQKAFFIYGINNYLVFYFHSRYDTSIKEEEIYIFK